MRISWSGGLVGLYPQSFWCCWSGNHTLSFYVQNRSSQILLHIRITWGMCKIPRWSTSYQLIHNPWGWNPWSLKQWCQPFGLCDLRSMHSDMTPTMTCHWTCAIPDSLALLPKKVHSFIYSFDSYLPELPGWGCARYWGYNNEQNSLSPGSS